MTLSLRKPMTALWHDGLLLVDTNTMGLWEDAYLPRTTFLSIESYSTPRVQASPMDKMQGDMSLWPESHCQCHLLTELIYNSKNPPSSQDGYPSPHCASNTERMLSVNSAPLWASSARNPLCPQACSIGYNTHPSGKNSRVLLVELLGPKPRSWKS